jgi:pyruvate/2-oxoglutarate dehydrogenase complex dihydrolipoamide acyltransferase (E2) component
MGEIRQVVVPDIGDFKDVPIIEISVKPGDRVKAEEPLITLESDKASMEVPSPSAGAVKSLAVKIGDKVSEGSPILTLELDGAGSIGEPKKPAVVAPPSPTSAPAGIAEVRVPDIGDFKDVPIIEVMVKEGDAIQAEQPLVTLESDKASMEVPSPLGGVVRDLKVKLGDRVKEGMIILTLVTEDTAAQAASHVIGGPARRVHARLVAEIQARGLLQQRRQAGHRGRSNFPMRDRQYASWRGSVASTCAKSRARDAAGESCRKTSRTSPRRLLSLRLHQALRTERGWACCLGQRSISPSSGRSRPNRSRASRRSPVRLCTATGS